MRSDSVQFLENRIAFVVILAYEPFVSKTT